MLLMNLFNGKFRDDELELSVINNYSCNSRGKYEFLSGEPNGTIGCLFKGAMNDVTILRIIHSRVPHEMQ